MSDTKDTLFLFVSRWEQTKIYGTSPKKGRYMNPPFFWTPFTQVYMVLKWGHSEHKSCKWSKLSIIKRIIMVVRNTSIDTNGDISESLFRNVWCLGY